MAAATRVRITLRPRVRGSQSDSSVGGGTRQPQGLTRAASGPVTVTVAIGEPQDGHRGDCGALSSRSSFESLSPGLLGPPSSEPLESSRGPSSSPAVTSIATTATVGAGGSRLEAGSSTSRFRAAPSLLPSGDTTGLRDVYIPSGCMQSWLRTLSGLKAASRVPYHPGHLRTPERRPASVLIVVAIELISIVTVWK